MKKSAIAIIIAISALIVTAFGLSACNEPKDHNCTSDTYVLQQVMREPTCTDPGLGLFVCPVENCNNSAELPIGLKPHSYVYSAATDKYICDVCGADAPEGYDPANPDNPDTPDDPDDPDKPDNPDDPDNPDVPDGTVDSASFTFVENTEDGIL